MYIIPTNNPFFCKFQVKKRQNHGQLYVTESIANRRLSSPPTLDKDVFNYHMGQHYKQVRFTHTVKNELFLFQDLTFSIHSFQKEGL